MCLTNPRRRHQSIMNMDTSEITINRIIGFVWDEEGTDVEDELPTPASSPTQIVVPAIPPAGTADPFGRGDGFDLELAKVICDVSVLPSLVYCRKWRCLRVRTRPTTLRRLLRH